jgi:hypothetical protein
MPLIFSAMLLGALRSCEAVEGVFLFLAGDGLADLPSRTSSFRGVCFRSGDIVNCHAGDAGIGGDVLSFASVGGVRGV